MSISTARNGPAMAALVAGGFAIGATEYLPAALLPVLARDLRVSLAAAGMLVSVYALGVTIASPFVAGFVGRLAPRRALVGLILLYFVTNVLAALAPGYGWLIAVRFLTAFGHGAYLAAAASVAAGLAGPGREARAIGLIFSGLSIAMATVVPLGTLLGDRVGWRAAFAGAAALGLIAAFAIRRFVPEGEQGAPPPPFFRQVPALRHPALMLTFATMVVGWAGIFCAFTYFSALLQKVSGLSPDRATLVLSFLGVGVTFGNLLGGRLADRNLYGGLVLLNGLLAGALLLFGLAAPYPLPASAVVVLTGLFIFSTGPGLQFLTMQQANRYAPGTEAVAAGLVQATINLGIAAGAFVGGLVVSSPLGLRGTPFVGAMLVFVALAMTAMGWRRDSAKGRGEPLYSVRRRE